MLVAVQVTLSLALITGAGLFARTLENLWHVNVGSDRDNDQAQASWTRCVRSLDQWTATCRSSASRLSAHKQRDSFLRERLLATISGFLGGLALLLACLGLYGLMAYAVARRTGEIGVRMALGARRRAIIWLIVRETVWPLLAGVAAGIPWPFGSHVMRRRSFSESQGLTQGASQLRLPS